MVLYLTIKKYWPSSKRQNTVSNTFPTIVLMGLDNKTITEIPLDRSKNGTVWGKGDKFLYVVTPSNGGSVIQRIDAATKQIRLWVLSMKGSEVSTQRKTRLPL